MSRYRSQGLLAVGLGLAAAACGDPDLNTDLRPAGAPEVLAVMYQNPLDLTESAVKCKYVDGKRDPKGPGFVGDPLTGGGVVCPEEEADFDAAHLDPRPLYTLNAAGAIIDTQPWALRVMFDELLDADRVETLECNEISGICEGTLADTTPVGLKCGTMNTEVAYTGYYVPNGNNTTFPLGPSLYVMPDPDSLTFPTGSTCTLTMDPARITDKDGVEVPEVDRSVQFQIADLALLSVDPAEPASGDPITVISPDPVAAGAAAFIFNASLDEAETDPAAFQLLDSTGAEIDTAIFVGAYNSAALTDAVYVFPDTATGIFLPGTYTATMKPTELTEVNGGKLTTTADETTHFAVAFGITGQTPASSGGIRDITTSCGGAAVCNSGVMRITFNNALDATTVTAADVELFSTTSIPPNAPIPFTLSVGNASSAGLANIGNNSILIKPDAELALGTYVVRIKAGAEVKDTDATAHIAAFSAPIATTFSARLRVTHTVPANAGTLAAAGSFDVVFSGTLDQATVGASEFELTDLTTNMPVPMALEPAMSVARAQPNPTPHANDTVRINPTADLVVGRMYRVTMKPGTSLTNVPPAGFSPVTATFATATTWTFTAN